MKNIKSITLSGVPAAIMFACGPFLYANIAGRGLFLYLAMFFAACVLLQAARNKGTLVIRRDGIVSWFVVCVAYQLLSFLWSPVNSGDALYTYTKVVLFFLMLSVCKFSSADRKLMIIAQSLIAIIAVAVMLTTKSYFEAGSWTSERLTFTFFGTALDPNYMCFLLVMPILFLLEKVCQKDEHGRFYRIICFVLLAYLLWGVLNTGSRGGLIGIVIACAIYLMSRTKLTLKKILVSILVTVVAVTAFQELLRFLPREVAERFSFEAVVEDRGTGRFDIWQDYLRTIFSDLWNIVFGAGNMSSVQTMGHAAHNYFLETLYEGGLIGAILMVIFYAKIIRKAYQKKQWLAFSGVIGALAMSMSLSCSRMLEFWLCITLANALLQDEDGQRGQQICQR